MKYLKKYILFERVSKDTKLFESVITKSEFPNELEIQEIFYDLTDEEYLSKCKLYESGYQYFSTDNLRISNINSDLFNDMTFEEDWINKKCEDLNDTWKNIFIDLSKPNNMLKLDLKQYLSSSIFYDDVYFSEVELSNGSNYFGGKSYLERLYENILNRVIPACSVIYLNLGTFKPEKLPVFIECLQRLYDMTGFRPTSSVWGEDYVDEDTGDIVSLVKADLQLYKVSDTEYKNLCKIFNVGNYTPEITKHFL